jgi:Amt family ammonium transporter
MLAFLAVVVMTLQWFLFGFSLAFSETGSQFLGDTTNFVFRNVNNAPFVGDRAECVGDRVCTLQCTN